MTWTSGMQTTKFALWGILVVGILVSVLPRLHCASTSDTLHRYTRSSKSCHDITLPVCKDTIPYNVTFFPNILGHKSQEEATENMSPMVPLINQNCSREMRFFLCSVFTPVCTIIPDAIPPCKNVCLQAKRGCETHLEKLTEDQKNVFDCDKYPASGLCVGENQTEGVTQSPHRPRYPVVPTPERVSPTQKGNGKDRKCRDINSRFCKKLNFTRASFPNIFGHKRPHMAEYLIRTEYKDFFPCSPMFKTFICSVMYSGCSKNQTRVLPCRSLCEAARTPICDAMMSQLSYEMPMLLECRFFPTPNQAECFDGQAIVSQTDGDSNRVTRHEISAQDTPSDCTQGAHRCSNATSSAYIDGQTHCCHNHQLLSISTSGPDRKLGNKACKCAFPAPLGIGSSNDNVTTH